MRRKDKEITDPAEIEKILKEAQVCRLAMVDGNRPYVVPLSFGFEGDSLYFHSGCKGMKIDILRVNPEVCFEMDLQGDVLEDEKPCEWTVQYRSVIGFGKAEFLEKTAEKREAFRIIMAHYSDSSFAFTEEMLKGVVIIRVKIAEISAKQSDC
jgi:nitroimidazol reductase NimA-like FMN-containing flavoprotein (pyridoxamine 5'-phosphate oxidase superfamily)